MTRSLVPVAFVDGQDASAEETLQGLVGARDRMSSTSLAHGFPPDGGTAGAMASVQHVTAWWAAPEIPDKRLVV